MVYIYIYWITVSWVYTSNFYMQIRFSEFASHRYRHDHCLIMLIMFSVYFKGIECLVGCVYASGLIIWGFHPFRQLFEYLFYFYSSFFIGWVKLGFIQFYLWNCLIFIFPDLSDLFRSVLNCINPVFVSYINKLLKFINVVFLVYPLSEYLGLIKAIWQCVEHMF